MIELLKEGNDWSLAAYASRIVEEEGGKMRIGVEFEVTNFSRVSAFLTHDRNDLKGDLNSEYGALLNHYMEYGTENTEFYQKKLAYFGNEHEIYYVIVWLNSPEQATEIILTAWYLLTNGNDFDFVAESFVDDEEEIKGRCSLRMINYEGNRTLERLFRIVSSPEEKQEDREDSEKLKSVTSTTLFHSACVYYVGAALCVGLNSAGWNGALGVWLYKQNEGYFDFGFSSGSDSHSAYVQARAAIAMANLADILTDLITQPKKVIIISHWHKDHISIVRQILSAAYNTFWRDSAWYVPDSASPAAAIVAGKLAASGGSLTVRPNSNPADNTLYRIKNNRNLTYGKIDAFIAPHPHHHGIYAKVMLTDLSGGFQQTLLLSGDCTYSGIPVAQKNGAAYLQACHHGGDYALPPSAGLRTVHIPVPMADPNYCNVIYSANGVTHGHPNPIFTAEHTAAGWTRQYVTHAAANGKLLIDYFDVT
jgi:hypothetical protein